MSWQARRYQPMVNRKMTKHHVPPRSKGAQFTLDKPENVHNAYHLLFGNAGSLEECISILRRDWWTPTDPDHRQQTLAF